MTTSDHTLRPGEWDGLPMPERLWAILAVAFGVGLSVLDSTIVNVALPTLASNLGVTEADSIWVVNAYQLATVTTMLSFAAIANQVGYRRIYTLGLILFTIASLGCTLCQTLPQLIAARVLQGVGAGAVTSINTTLIRIIYPKRHLGRGMGLNATVVAVASVAGPSIASAILSVAEWPWLFAINLPIGVAAITLCFRFLPPNPVQSRGRRFDWRDGLLNALFFGLLFTVAEAFIEGVSTTWLLTGSVALLGVGWYFVRSQLHKENPILPFDLLRIPIFSFSVATSICSYLAQMASMVAIPFLLQYRLGFSDVETGFLFTAWPAITILVSPLAGLLIERVHAGLLGGVGLLIMALGILLTATLPVGASTGQIILTLMIAGCGFALFQSPNNSILVASAPPERSGSASGMQGTARLIGQTSGAALVAALFHLYDPAIGCRYALYTASILSLAGSLFSFSRLRLPLPEGLKRR